MATKLNPWELFKVPPNVAAGVYADWGVHYKAKNLFPQSANAFNDSLDLKPNDLRALLGRSSTLRNMGKIQDAFDDLKQCQGIVHNNVTVDATICSVLYDLNHLEEAIIENYKNMNKYKGHKISDFRTTVSVLEENFKDSLGDSLGPFIMKNNHVFHIVADLFQKQKIIDDRPLWKKLRSENKCDVQSVPDIEPIELHPREIARRERAFRVFLQTYFNKSWQEVIFLLDLQKNPNFLLPIAKSKIGDLNHLACNANESIMKFLKMLQVRSPLYNEKRRICPNAAHCERTKDRRLNFIQYQTRRFMVKSLRYAHKFKNAGNVKDLAKLVEYAMGDFTILKTFRVMPWKFEYLNDMYNLLGLAFVDKLEIPVNLTETDANHHLKKLLRLSTEPTQPPPTFVFGDHSTFVDSNANDPKQEALKLYFERLKKRLLFAKYPIEQTYLYHELARNHIKQLNFDEAVPLARKGVEASKQCNNKVWHFLNILQIVRSRAALNKLEYLKDALDEAEIAATKLENEILVEYIKEGQKFSNALYVKRMTEVKIATLRVRKSQMSIKSRSSVASSSISSRRSATTVEKPNLGMMSKKNSENNN